MNSTDHQIIGAVSCYNNHVTSPLFGSACELE